MPRVRRRCLGVLRRGAIRHCHRPTGRTNVPVAVQVAFYRLCQESLNNVAKHAGASQVVIDLAYGDSHVELHIRDDGCGFDPTHLPSGSHGLSIMRERAKAIGAALSVVSQPQRGTEILIHWMENREQEVT